MAGKIDRFIAHVSFVNNWVGKITAFLLPLIILFVSIGVVMRYFFNSPTIWAWDVNVMLMAVMVFFGAAIRSCTRGM